MTDSGSGRRDADRIQLPGRSTEDGSGAAVRTRRSPAAPAAGDGDGQGSAFPRPAAAALLARLINPIDHFFDWLYGSRYNPLYRSGTLTVGLLTVIGLTGLYLLFFYDVGAPYQSMQRIQSQVWFGRWMRALHRYASDACVVTVSFHILHLLIQGRTWGPRTLAWISGVILLVTLMVSGWTGYVMVWDVHGQLLADAGARMLQLAPFLRDTLGQAFNGGTPVTSSFFFMNLFLHVALPLAMILGLWVHTAKLARSVWFPLKPVLLVSTAALLALSLLWPAPLPAEADLLLAPGAVEVDLFYGFWLPLVESGHAIWALLLLTGGTALGVAVPWFWRPARAKRPAPSTSDEQACTGCRQCSRDCPYEAIAMVPREDGGRPHSRVNPELCVSCGICSASCEQLAIGPVLRKGADQLVVLEQFTRRRSVGAKPDGVVAIVCRCNPGASSWIARYVADRPGLSLYPVDCVGTVHSRIVEGLLQSHAGVFVWGCPSRNCLSREGVNLLEQRSSDRRPPAIRRQIESGRIAIESLSLGERRLLRERLETFESRMCGESGTSEERRARTAIAQPVRAAVATALLLLALGGMSQLSMGDEPTHGTLRIGARLPGLVIEECRELSPEELDNRLAHMRLSRECRRIALRYMLTVEVDGLPAIQRTLEPAGVRDDRPLSVNEEIAVAPGKHQVSVLLEPEAGAPDTALRLLLRESVEVEHGKIYLVTYDVEAKRLRLRFATGALQRNLELPVSGSRAP